MKYAEDTGERCRIRGCSGTLHERFAWDQVRQQRVLAAIYCSICGVRYEFVRQEVP